MNKKQIIIGFFIVLAVVAIARLLVPEEVQPASNLAASAAMSFDIEERPVVAANAAAATEQKPKQYLISTDEKGNLTNTDLIVNQICPTGTIMIWSTDVAPDGWLLCDGQSYPRNDYANLYNVIQNIYGGDATKFNVPDLTGRTVFGKKTGWNINSSGGLEKVTLKIDQIPNHNHIAGGYNEWVVLRPDVYMNRAWKPGSNADRTVCDTAGSDDIKRRLDTVIVAAGGGGEHENMPPYRILNYIIKY